MALPAGHRVGVIFGPSSAALEGRASRAGRERDLTLNSPKSRGRRAFTARCRKCCPRATCCWHSRPGGLQRIDDLRPDADELSRTGTRRRFSEGLVKAGACSGLFSTAPAAGDRARRSPVAYCPAKANCPRRNIRKLLHGARESDRGTVVGLLARGRDGARAALARRAETRREDAARRSHHGFQPAREVAMKHLGNPCARAVPGARCRAS